MPEATRDKLRQRFLDRYSELIPPGPRGQVSEGSRVHRPYVRSDERAIGYVPYAKGELPNPLPATLVAFYLPQFHTIPENDEWWGKGFTEWRNVTRALPQFEGHYQPKLPGDLGFYDLRNPEVMREQARLAREYGISAFCFYFYWFGGKTLLETPLRNWLADPTIDLKFCLCWANEKWTRTWDGRGDEILIDQKHSPEDDLAFIAYVAEYMRDPRYLRVDGKPMLLVYRPGLFPDMAATAARWRRWCLENGIGEIHLAYVQSFERPDPRTIGFDAAVEFPPNLSSSPSIADRQRLINVDYAGQILDWRELAHQQQSRERPDYLTYPGVNPNWDNEARRPGNGRVYLHASPRKYRDWLKNIIAKHQLDRPLSQQLVFINAWNEWAEGAIIEPDARLGYAYLDANRRAVLSSINGSSPAQGVPSAIIHVWHVDVFDEIIDAIRESGTNWRVIVTTVAEHAPSVHTRLDRLQMPSEVFIAENRGRDILPFLRAANQLLDEGVDVALKLHTKRSLHRENGETWRRELIARLVDKSRVSRILAAFSRQPDLGLIGPEGHILPVSQYLGANEGAVDYLRIRMGAGKPASDTDIFLSGSMFWVRLEALRPLLDAHFSESEFEPEASQLDGTFAHAMERAFGICADTAGFRVASAASVCGQSETQSTSYDYARKW